MLIEKNEYKIWKKKMRSNAKSKITMGSVARIRIDTIRRRYEMHCNPYTMISEFRGKYKDCISHYDDGINVCMTNLLYGKMN